jgi:hypothetical protein
LLPTGKGKGKMDGNTKHETWLCKKEMVAVGVTQNNLFSLLGYIYIYIYVALQTCL